MQRFVAILVWAHLLTSFSASSQPASSAAQYPFITYTTKDGLVSNRVRKMFQDSWGRLYFLTYNGLSVYDGSRFTNFDTQNGLPDEIVNDVIEMGDDSLWIAANTYEVDCLVHGKISKLRTADEYCPTVNQFCRDADGKLFAASDQGIFLYEENRFKRLSFKDPGGDNAGQLITHIQPLDDHLMLAQRDPLQSSNIPLLFLYDYKQQKPVASMSAFDFVKAPGNNIWVITKDGVRVVDMAAIAENKLQLRSLPLRYSAIGGYTPAYVCFDKSGNCWLPSSSGLLTKCDEYGKLSFYSAQNEKDPDVVFQDKEGILWIHFLQGGMTKLAETDLSVFDEVFGLHNVSTLDFGHGTLVLYDRETKSMVVSRGGSTRSYSFPDNMPLAEEVKITSKGMFATSGSHAYKLIPGARNQVIIIPVKVDSSFTQSYGKGIEDNFGNLVLMGNKYVTAIIDGTRTANNVINYFADEPAKDKAGNIWVASRRDQVIEFSVHPETPATYLQINKHYEEEFRHMNIRSACFDSSGNMWLGTRQDGVYRVTFGKDKMSMIHITEKDGLSDNFNSYLACDPDNNVWTCSPTGLDKISFSSGKIIINNITQECGLTGKVSKVVFDDQGTAWALTDAGTVFKVARESKEPLNYTPRLYLSYARAGRDTMPAASSYKFSHRDNGLSFYFAAPSYFLEKQIQYSLRLLGSGDTSWSQSSPTSSISLLNLAPGSYVLQAHVSFPAARYADQEIQIPFSILPPWWKTKWFTALLLFSVLVLFLIAVRLFVRRKLAKQRIILEKQQAVEKERTRIAIDMHDDLGAGLSRIKFLSDIVKLKTQSKQPAEEDISKIGQYAREMISKMGEIIWALDKKNDSVNGLVAYTRVYAVDYLAQNGLTVNIQTPDNANDKFVTGEVRRNIFLTVKEALHNVVKHAKADEVNIEITTGTNILITISDNGVGIDKGNMRPFSNGITNMRKRMADVGGSIEIKNSHGTHVHITVPLDV